MLRDRSPEFITAIEPVLTILTDDVSQLARVVGGNLTLI